MLFRITNTPSSLSVCDVAEPSEATEPKNQWREQHYQEGRDTEDRYIISYPKCGHEGHEEKDEYQRESDKKDQKFVLPLLISRFGLQSALATELQRRLRRRLMDMNMLMDLLTILVSRVIGHFYYLTCERVSRLTCRLLTPSLPQLLEAV